MSSEQLMRHTQNNGFSLLQMAMLVAVAGVIVASMIPGGKLGSEAEKEAITKKRMKAIEETTKGFMVKNLRRPCPADGSLATSNAEYGLEAAYVGVCTGASSPDANFSDSQSVTGTWLTSAKTVTSLSSLTGINVGSYITTTGSGIPTNTFVSSIDSTNQITLDKTPTIAGTGSALAFSTYAAGTVPTRTLGLPDEYGFDGYGRRIMYIVDKRATRPYSNDALTSSTTSSLSSAPKSCYDLQNQGLKGAIKVYGTASDTTVKDNTMWALISYGKAGHGAFSAGGDGDATGASRINAAGTAADTTIPDAGQINAFIDPTSDFTTKFEGKLVRQEPDPTSPYNTTVWYDEDSKNTCCLGKACALGTNVGMALVNTADTYTGMNLAKGDINGDGIVDLIVGNSSHGSNLGAVNSNNRVYVIFGKKTGWPVEKPINLADITTGGDGSHGFYVQSDLISVTMFGKSVAAGDVNRDGFDDVIIYSRNNYYVVFGKASFASTPSILTSVLATDINLGIILRLGGGALMKSITVGDMQGNGYKSIVAFGANNVVWAIYDKTDSAWETLYAGARMTAGPPKWWQIDSGSNGIVAGEGFRFTTASTDYQMGAAGVNPSYFYSAFALASGDVDGNGYDDIIVGDTNSTLAATANKGKVLVFFSDASSPRYTASGTPYTVPILTNIFDGASPPVKGTAISSGAANSYLGVNVETADMNNDGIKDIITANDSHIYIYYGKTTWPLTVDLTALTPGTDGLDINTNTNRPAGFGGSVPHFPNITRTGDVNNDGRMDLLFGTFGLVSYPDPVACSATGSNMGSIYVILQPATGWPTTNTTFFRSLLVGETICTGAEINTTDFPGSFRIDGANATDYAYIPVVGDFNADGRNDIAIAAPGDDTSIGSVFMLWGRKNIPWESVVDLSVVDF